MSKGVEYNLYGGPAWPNNILYTPLAVISGIISTTLGAFFGEPTSLGERIDPPATPLVVYLSGAFIYRFPHDLV